MIRFDHATKRYPDGTVAVDDLELEAPSGKITVLVGPSGCGKTTSLRMINRMIEPTSGTIWLDDTDTASMPAHELRRQIGYVIQHAGLFPHRTIVDNVATVPVPARHRQEAGPRPRDGAPRARRPRPRVRQALPGPALRRPAAARRRRPGAGRRPARDADGRAVLGRRPGGPRPAPGRVPAAAGRARQDDRVRHPRHRRGDQARRPGGGAAGRRHAGPARRRRPSCSPDRSTRSWPAFVGRDRGYRALGFTSAGTIADPRRAHRRDGRVAPDQERRLAARRRRRRARRRAG